jgi:hypothetical protein
MTVYGMQLNSSSLDIDCDGEQQTIELTEENIKKLGINCKNESVTLQDSRPLLTCHRHPLGKNRLL